MTHLSAGRLDEILDGLQGKRIAVVGDLMLDRYIWGSVSRISPEAPVPVVDVDTEQLRLGGAANVAKNIKSLGGTPLLLGAIGADNSGKQLLELLGESGFPDEGIITDADRPTTVKTRVIAHDQHVVRIDRESRTEIALPAQAKILDVLRKSIDRIDGIIIEDYNKGVVVATLIRDVTDLARRNHKIITVDPKFNNFFEYRNVTVFKPNRNEVEEVTGERLRTDEDVLRIGNNLLSRLGADNILLTLGEQGMALFERNGTVSRVPTAAKNVADVSGAGDTVISTLTMALVGGASMKEAATLANCAGGIVCGYVGIVPVDRDELVRTVRAIMNHQPDKHHGPDRHP